MGVSAEDLYTALLANAELQPPNWNLQGRQADIWKQLSKTTLFNSEGSFIIIVPASRLYTTRYVFSRRR
jgi:hypothetical protein